MPDLLKDWRGWLRDWPLYAAVALDMIVLSAALEAGFALFAALAGLGGFALVICALIMDAGSRE